MDRWVDLLSNLAGDVQSRASFGGTASANPIFAERSWISSLVEDASVAHGCWVK